MQAQLRVSYEHIPIWSNLTGIFIKDLETKKKRTNNLNSFQLLATKLKQIERGLTTSNDTVSYNDVKLRCWSDSWPFLI